MKRSIGSAVAGVVLLLTGCTGSDDASEATPTPTRTTPSPTPTPTPTYGPDTIAAQLDRPVVGGDLRGVGGVVDAGPYTRQEVRYRSDDLTVSGVLLVPDGDGPFPAVVLNHGYIDPAVYRPGQGMAREQDFFARRGWVVLHVDYRGHAGGDDASALERELRVGYARDAIAAVKALRERDDVDPDRIGMVGRSMGGGVTLSALVIEPDVVGAAVTHSSVSSRFEDNFRRWTEPSRPDQARAFTDRFGTPEEAPGWWAAMSPRTYLDRLEAPLLMVHGELDDQCPVAWSRATDRALQAVGADAEVVEYPDEGHTFSRRWPDKMQRTLEFLDRRLGA